MAEFALRGGEVYVGVDELPVRADVAIDCGRIVDVDEVAGGRRLATREEDVTGLAVCPGFIDMHAHSDLAVVTDPVRRAKTLQGVTLEVIGQDGLGYAPGGERTRAEMRLRLTAWNGEPVGLDEAVVIVDDCLNVVDRGAPVNVAMLLAPHGTIRHDVMGMTTADPAHVWRSGSGWAPYPQFGRARRDRDRSSRSRRRSALRRRGGWPHHRTLEPSDAARGHHQSGAQHRGHRSCARVGSHSDTDASARAPGARAARRAHDLTSGRRGSPPQREQRQASHPPTRASRARRAIGRQVHRRGRADR